MRRRDAFRPQNFHLNFLSVWCVWWIKRVPLSLDTYCWLNAYRNNRFNGLLICISYIQHSFKMKKHKDEAVTPRLRCHTQKPITHNSHSILSAWSIDWKTFHFVFRCLINIYTNNRAIIITTIIYYPPNADTNCEGVYCDVVCAHFCLFYIEPRNPFAISTMIYTIVSDKRAQHAAKMLAVYLSAPRAHRISLVWSGLVWSGLCVVCNIFFSSNRPAMSWIANCNTMYIKYI